MRRVFAAAIALSLLPACRGREGSAQPPQAESSTSDAPTPVQVAAVSRMSLAEIVSGPGRTAALTQQRVRAPFAGTLVELRVSDGDPVSKGQPIGTIVSRETEAALSGAREMLREAQTPAQRSDAERALALAERNLVKKALLATADGPVLSHAAAGGDRVSEDQEIIAIADAASIVFLADMPQSDLSRIRPGQPAQVVLGGRPAPLTGSVHSILPGANTTDYTGSVRIDLPRLAERLSIGLFGTARVTVASHAGALVIPDAAVIRDDVTGVSRVATVVNGHAHWLTVTTGLKQDGMTEIAGPELAAGMTVIESGMVGLPEGKSVSVPSR